MEKRIYDILKENGYNGYVNVITQGNLAYIDIRDGDWKHDHGYVDWVMENKLNYHKITENVTFSDGCDSYSSEHIYCKKTD